jgi:hypothetical protein
MSGYLSLGDGGCTIESLNLQMDDGRGNAFTSVTGEANPYLALTFTASGLQRSLLYRFRYRTQNCKGWSEFSETLFALTSQVPESPMAPELISQSANLVQLRVIPSSDSYGAIITDYRLFRN